MSFHSTSVVILTRTVMSHGVCVGAYDTDHGRMLRLLDNHARRLTENAPFEIGEVYSMTYAEKYDLEAPHIEDVAVYKYAYRYNLDDDEFEDLIIDLTEYNLSLEELFEGKLNWNVSGFILKEDTPSFSVQIATLDCDLEKRDEYFCVLGMLRIIRKRIKYVGEVPIENLPNRIPSGSKIRFSLARFWDQGDGTPRAYLQISGVY